MYFGVYKSRIMKIFYLSILLTAFLFSPNVLEAQRKKKVETTAAKEVDLSAFTLRNVGPAFLSGRIADIAIHPHDENKWYVAVGSGGVW